MSNGEWVSSALHLRHHYTISDPTAAGGVGGGGLLMWKACSFKVSLGHASKQHLLLFFADTKPKEFILT